MPDFKIFETNQFINDLDTVGKNLKKKIDEKIRNYAYPRLKVNPFYGKNIKKLVNYNPPTWRYRIGDYRLFYEIDQKEKLIFIIALEMRSNAY